VGPVILVTVCFPIESRWIPRRSDVRVVRTAVGDAAAETLDALGDDATGTALLIATGFAGGVDPRIRRGDLVLARTVRHRGEELEIDRRLLDRARQAVNSDSTVLHVGPCESADRVLGPSDKRGLAEDAVTSVDMESGGLARWAAARAIPFLSLRAVLDPVDSDVPFPADRPFWLSALRHPVAAARTVRHATIAGQAIGSAVSAVVDAFSGGLHA